MVSPTLSVAVKRGVNLGNDCIDGLDSTVEKGLLKWLGQYFLSDRFTSWR